MRRKILVCAVLSFCMAAFSSCGNDGDNRNSAQISSEITVHTLSETSEIQVTEEPMKTLPEETGEQQTSGTAAETSADETSEITESETTLTESSVQNETESETSTEISESVTESETVPQEITEISETATSEKKAEIVIPEIRVPLASGVNVISGENAEIDYSCADEGYISAVYTGKSTAAKLRIKCGDLQYDHDLAADGRTEFFPLMGSGSYTVKAYELVSGKSYAEAASGSFEAKIKSDTAMYLYPNKYSSFDSSSECVEKAAELCSGKTSEVEKIAAIFGYISENITYDKELAATVKSGYVPDPDKTLARGKGICFDYASLFTAMCRSQGIPSRLVTGYAEPNIYHAWNEVYTEETGWITPELFLKKKGYNIADATFYAGNKDKEKIAGYISDDSNYSAMYRY